MEAKLSLKIVAAVFLSFLCMSCGKNDENAADVIVRLGNSTLSRTQLMQNMPGGLSPDDSTRYARAYINTWIDSHLITDIASREIDMDEIDRLTADYRRQLIMQRYRNRMFETHAPTISEDSLRAYYDSHRSEFVLERPLVRGVYLKVPDDAGDLAQLRRLYRSDKPEDIDRLEKEVLKSAIHYDYFRDRWVDWEQIESRIPYDFGSEPGVWLKNSRRLDESLGGFTYLLYITDVLPVGSAMPFESAKPMITQRLLVPARRAYELTLTGALRERAVKDGELMINVDME
ncbi:MAG: peptidylprolyl isomerase [Bacteroidales bacterium]|nr:peptidylprolyl isomerase [Bacteroidales bacterium]